jgi:hypothetical protein
VPRIVGVELNPSHVAGLRRRFAHSRRVAIRHESFLKDSADRFDYVIANPPYVAITALSEQERELYRRTYSTAKGRFDLYLLFFEQAMRLLKPGGRLVFITPEKFLYVETAEPLRALLARIAVEELHFLDEETFGELVTYPLISTVTNARPKAPTRVRHRDGSTAHARLDSLRGSWMPLLRGIAHVTRADHGVTLADICIRVSCGVATGADAIYTVRNTALPPELRRFAYPTISGRQLRAGEPITVTHSLLVPYDRTGQLLPESELGALRAYLNEPARRAKLLARTCVARKPWYAFHENPPLPDILRPKVLCKDIGAEPFFLINRAGTIVPRHTVYYIVPREPSQLDALATYLNSDRAKQWLRDHCQRAANGYVRLQSHVIKRLPVPNELAEPTVRTKIARVDVEPALAIAN